MSLFIGIDLGTSGCRAIAIDENGVVKSMVSSPLPESTSPAEGYQQQNPLEWWQAVIKLLQAIGEETADQSVDGIAVDGTSSTLLLTDRQGEPLTPALMYNDTRSRDGLELLKILAPEGSPVLSASSSLAKLLHLNKKIGSQSFYALHQADWILGQLSGEIPISDENNALKLGYDPIKRQWPVWISQLDIPFEAFPKVYPCGTKVGKLSKHVADVTGLMPGIPIVTGTTDSNAACLASGATAIGDAVTSLGSTLVLKILSDHPVFDSQYGIYSHRLGDRWLVGGASNSGGAVLRHHFNDQEMARLSPELKPDQPTGLDYYPLNSPGERFPVNDPDLPPKLVPKPNSDLLFFQGLLEGIANIEQQGYQRLASLGTPTPKQIFSIGGGAINEPWRIMRQQRLKVPVIRSEQQEAAYGVALLALKGVNPS
ncbi:MAG: FGGY-family carbohydrate kinase [Candidatus Thiodiazotropha sp. 6PLUC1]